MIKSIVFFNRRADLTVEAFQDYWLNRHADVVCRLPGLRRYVQSHTLLGGYRKGQPAFVYVRRKYLVAHGPRLVDEYGQLAGVTHVIGAKCGKELNRVMGL